MNRCIRCGLDCKESERRADFHPGDDHDFDRAEGRCYPCHFEFLYDMYGGALEPTFKVGGKLFDSFGNCIGDDADFAPSPGSEEGNDGDDIIEIPF